MDTWDILGLGECMIELFEEPAGSGTYKRAVGGDTLNTLAIASRLGARTAYLTRLGDDQFQAPIRATFAEHGVDGSLAAVGPGFNGLYFIEVDDRGERRFHYVRTGSAASRMQPGDLSTAVAASAKILFTSGITQAISATARATVLHAVRAAKATGRQVAFDANFRPRLTSSADAAAGLRELLPHIDVLFLSEDDMPVAAEATHVPCGSPKKLAAELWERGVSTLVCKAGPGPVVIYDRAGRQVLEVQPPTVTAVDTSGAGDVFNGAFLQGLAHGLSLEAMTKQAAAAGALQVTARGTLLALPGAAAVRAAAHALSVVHRPVD